MWMLRLGGHYYNLYKSINLFSKMDSKLRPQSQSLPHHFLSQGGLMIYAYHHA